MKPITFEFVHKTTNGRQRIYKASEKMTKNAGGKDYYGFGEILKVYKNKTGDETVDFIIPSYFQFVVISDAHTHTERLAFPAWECKPIRSNNPCIHRCDTIAGVNTFMIHGGDSRAVKPDAVYLRMLSKANGYQYKRTAEVKL